MLSDRSMVTQVLVTTVLPLLHSLAAGVRVTEVEVPRYLVVGQKASLRCHFSLEGDALYSLKWWKDGKQFYQYIPRSDPPTVVFTVPGITVNPSSSGVDEVELMDVQSSSTGTYKCEVVGESPTFATHALGANMTIVDTPDSKPKVSGLQPSYREGETISLNCSSVRSRPVAQLAWFHNGLEVAKEHLVTYPPTSEGSPALYTSTLGVTLTASPKVFTEGILTLKCSATVHMYEWSTDVTLHLDNVTYSQPHHLPTLQQTDIGASATPSQTIVVVIATLTLCLGSPS